MTLEEQIKALLEAKEKEDKDADDAKEQADRVDQDPAVKIENPMDPNLTSSETPEGEIAAADAQGEDMDGKMKPVKESIDTLTSEFEPSDPGYSINALKSIPKERYNSHAKWLASEFHTQNIRNEDDGIPMYHEIANADNVDDLADYHQGYADQAHIIKTLKHMKDVHGVSVDVRKGLSSKDHELLINTSRGYGRGSNLRESTDGISSIDISNMSDVDVQKHANRLHRSFKQLDSWANEEGLDNYSERVKDSNYSNHWSTVEQTALKSAIDHISKTRGIVPGKTSKLSTTSAYSDSRGHSGTPKYFDESISDLLEYHIKGTVNGKKFQSATDDEYSASDIKKQNPHLTDDEAKAIQDHTYSDEFMDGNEYTSSNQGKHRVIVHTNGGYSGDVSDTMSKIGVKESISDLLGDEFSDEFKVKAHTIFEAAVKDQVIKFQAKLQEEHNAAVAKLEEQFEEKFLQRSKHLEEETSDKIDGYLNFLAEEWKKENEVALEVAIKSELTESFINSLKTVFEQHYIDLPEDKVDLYSKVVEEKSEVETALATTVGSLAKLTEELNQIKREQIITEAAKDFSSMDKSRFQSLTEDFAFDDAESFKTKVGIVKKSFFGNKSTAAKEQLTEELVKTEVIVETNEPVTLNENTAMSAYVTALRKNKK